MIGEKNNKEFRFAKFSINKTQQILTHGSQKIVINTKAYYLLLTFLENHGRILSKDDLINAVWPGQIVTDTALTKQIVRLRKVIGDTDSNNPMIETHRGVGYRFAIPVELHETLEVQADIHKKKSNKNNNNKWILISTILAIILITTVYYFNKGKINTVHYTKNPQEIKKIQTGIGIAIIPSNNKQDWLNTGGINYLSKMLDENTLIYSIKPRPEWYKNTETEKLAIEVTSHKNIHYAFLVNIDENEEGLTADVKIRTYEKIVASDTISAKNTTQMLVKINNWIGKILLADDKVKEFYTNKTISYDNYALESYLQGVFQQEFNNDQKANEYYQAAVNKDKDFIPAWLQLADTFKRMSENEKAISVAENTLNTFADKLSTKQLIKLNYIIAGAYFGLNDKDQAINYLNKSTQFIEDVENPLTKLTALDSLVALAFQQQDWKKAEEYTKQNIAIAKDFFPFPNYLAAMDLLMAEIKGSQGKLDESKQYLYSAINFYEKIDNAGGMIRALVSMSQINLMQNQYEEGINLAFKAKPYLEKIENPDYVFKFLEKTCYITNLRGLFNQTDSYLKQMQQIATQSSNPFYLVSIESIKLHKNYVQNNFNQAAVHVSNIKHIFDNNARFAPYKSMYLLMDLLVSARDSRQTAQQVLTKYNQYLANNPTIKDFDYEASIERSFGNINVRLGNINEGIESLKSAEQKNRKNSNISTANHIGFEILEVMLKHPEIDYKPTLARISSYTKYDYLFFKLKAQFLAREGKYFDASIIMSENKQKANQLWNAGDQLLLEEFQKKSKVL